MDFDHLSEEDPINEALKDYQVDYTDSLYNQKTNPLVKKTLKQQFNSPRFKKQVQQLISKESSSSFNSSSEKRDSLSPLKTGISSVFEKSEKSHLSKIKLPKKDSLISQILKDKSATTKAKPLNLRFQTNPSSDSFDQNAIPSLDKM